MRLLGLRIKLHISCIPISHCDAWQLTMILHNDPELMSLADAAKSLPGSVSASTVWRWCHNGLRGVVLDSIRIGGRIYTTPRALQAFCETVSRRHKPVITHGPTRAQIVAMEAELRRLGLRF